MENDESRSSSGTMATVTFSNAPDISADDYCVFGLATCFVREEGEVSQVQVVEPIPSSALEAILKNVPTSYEMACAKPLGEVVKGEQIAIPAEFPEDVQFADNFIERAIAAARTYKNRPVAKEHIPLGSVHKGFNYSLERKRILNAENIVTKEDNVKQHEYTHKVL